MRIDINFDRIPYKNPNPVDQVAHSYFPKERMWQSHVERSFATQGWLVYHTWNSQRSEAGFPDLVMVLPGVATIFAELKIETGKLTFDQEKWLLALAWSNEMVYLWRPSDASEIRDVIQDCHALSLNFGRRLTEDVVGGKV